MRNIERYKQKNTLFTYLCRAWEGCSGYYHLYYQRYAIKNLINYNDGEIEIPISIKEDTIWLTQKQIAELFGVTKQNISLHTIEIFKSQELEKSSTVKKYLTVQKEGNREVSRELEHYNLDVIISVGYRVNSKKATKFRQ